VSFQLPPHELTTSGSAARAFDIGSRAAALRLEMKVRLRIDYSSWPSRRCDAAG
jgi:hypothetical protein